MRGPLSQILSLDPGLDFLLEEAMMTRMHSLGLYLLCFVILGCSEGPNVAVKTHIDRDSGEKVDYLSKFHFRFSYNANLTLVDSLDHKQVSITNRNMVESTRSQSVIQLEVLEPQKDYEKFSTSTELNDHLAPMAAWAEREYPGKTFSPVTFPGAIGIFCETSGRESLESQYFLITTSFVFLKIEIRAFVAGNGFALISPIVHTFAAYPNNK